METFANPPAGAAYRGNQWARIARCLARRGDADGWVSKTSLHRCTRTIVADDLTRELNRHSHILERRIVETGTKPREEFKLRDTLKT